MNNTFSAYIAAFDELNILTSTSYYSASGKDMTSKVAQIADDILSLLIRAYQQGITATADMLAYDLTVDVGSMEEAIYEVIDGKTFEDRIADHVIAGDLSGLQTLVESEYHRVFNAAEEDGAYEFQSTRGLGVSKKWVTVRDEAVRDTHKYLEGVSVALDEEFYTFDGDHASRPGEFTKAVGREICRDSKEVLHMIDCENEVYTRLAKILREKFPKIDIASEYVKSPSSFPHVSITQSDCYIPTEWQDSSMKENMVIAMFEINVYSNKAEGKKTECKKIIKEINDALYSMNFRRTAMTPVPNMEDATIYRITARFRVATDGKHFYRR